LREDHEKAKQFARALSEMKNIRIDADKVQTNILIFKLKNLTAKTFLEKLKKENILMSAVGKYKIRVVTHMDVNFADIYRAIEKVKMLTKS